MARFEIKMPELGENITEGTILSWSVQVGGRINEDDVLFEVNTAKVSAEIPSPVSGKVVEILFKEGDTVPVGTVVAIVDMDGEGSVETSETKDSAEGASVFEAAEASSAASTPNVKAGTTISKVERWYSPAVLQLARKVKIPQEELDAIPGTGYEGWLSKKDIRHCVEMKRSAPVADAPVAMSSAVKVNTPASSPATPVAAEISKKPVAVASQSLSPSVSDASVEVKEIDRVRSIIADHMVMSRRVSPHVTNVVEVDVTRLVCWREKNKDVFFRREGVELTYMPAIAEATAQVLAACPQANVSVDGYSILYKEHINVGVAVSQDDGNLIVPVIHDADRLNLSGLAVVIDSLVRKARVNKLMPDGIDGGTLIITNFSTFKMLFGMSIINQPQVVVLGVGVIGKKPAIVETPRGSVIAIRHRMHLSLSYDHRVVDGSLGGNFLHLIADYLGNWKE